MPAYLFAKRIYALIPWGLVGPVALAGCIVLATSLYGFGFRVFGLQVGVEGAKPQIERLNNDLQDMKRERDQARAELDKLEEAGKARKQATERASEDAARRDDEAADEARRIEEAPLPGDCRTPDAVLEADI